MHGDMKKTSHGGTEARGKKITTEIHGEDLAQGHGGTGEEDNHGGHGVQHGGQRGREENKARPPSPSKLSAGQQNSVQNSKLSAGQQNSVVSYS